uniref:Uncharacterized protein n=1 Tax=Noccaea caerulescens TaxID=107243 RepID=A0A1J3I9I7_NOCCA
MINPVLLSEPVVLWKSGFNHRLFPVPIPVLERQGFVEEAGRLGSYWSISCWMGWPCLDKCLPQKRALVQSRQIVEGD